MYVLRQDCSQCGDASLKTLVSGKQLLDGGKYWILIAFEWHIRSQNLVTP